MPRKRRPRGQHRGQHGERRQRQGQGALDGVVVDAHGDVADDHAGVPAVAREHPLGVEQTRHDPERGNSTSQRTPTPTRRTGAAARASRKRRPAARPAPHRSRPTYPSSCHSRPAATATSHVARRDQQHHLGGRGPVRGNGDGEERAADQHRHEDAPARLEDDGPVGVPGDAEVDQAEAGEYQPGQGEERREDAGDDHAHGAQHASGARRRGVDRVARRPGRPASPARPPVPALASSSAMHAALPPT